VAEKPSLYLELLTSTFPKSTFWYLIALLQWLYKWISLSVDFGFLPNSTQTNLAISKHIIIQLEDFKDMAMIISLIALFIIKVGCD
jgi:hypothetical protein